MSLHLLYITAPNIEEAKQISRVLLEEKLAACVNIFPEVISMYRWEGNLEEQKEVAMIVKTTTEKIEPIKQRLLKVHPYQCPCLLVLKVEDGNKTYLDWVESCL